MKRILIPSFSLIVLGALCTNPSLTLILVLLGGTGIAADTLLQE